MECWRRSSFCFQMIRLWKCCKNAGFVKLLLWRISPDFWEGKFFNYSECTYSGKGVVVNWMFMLRPASRTLNVLTSCINISPSPQQQMLEFMYCRAIVSAWRFQCKAGVDVRNRSAKETISSSGTTLSLTKWAGTCTFCSILRPEFQIYNGNLSMTNSFYFDFTYWWALPVYLGFSERCEIRFSDTCFSIWLGVIYVEGPMKSEGVDG